MTLSEIIEDAFLSALEDGADPPRTFTIQLPFSAFADPRDDGLTVRIAGYAVTAEIEGSSETRVH